MHNRTIKGYRPGRAIATSAFAIPGVAASVRSGMRRRLKLMTETAGDRGMSTAEYAVGTIAACGFAALLYKVVTSAEIQEMLVELINRALGVGA